MGALNLYFKVPGLDDGLLMNVEAADPLLIDVPFTRFSLQ